MFFPFVPALKRVAAALALVAVAAPLRAEPQHGIAMYGDPALAPDFEALPYVNPDAPKGGRIVFGESGTFNSLNPHILQGNAPWAVGSYVFESLMGRNWDEPFSLYGLLAESVEVGEDRDWVEFTLRPEAAFSDGTPVTVEDVVWSFETLGQEGHPRYRNAWSAVESIEATGERTVRIEFNTADRELPLIMGLRPVLSKAQWEGRDFTRSGFDPVPIGSGPYTIGEHEAGRYIDLERDPDWWGADLAFNRGQHNFDTLRYEFFGDGDVVLEAFRAGAIDSYRETSASDWATRYDFPAVQAGDIVLSEIPHERPSGIRGFAMNLRNPLFEDWRVREAMIHAFNFEFINQTLSAGRQPRITSYFSNSELAMGEGPAEGRVAELLEPHAEALLPGALDGYAPPAADGSERNRAGLRAATRLLQEAGWSAQGGTLRDAEGTPFAFDILLSQAAPQTQQIAEIYASALRRLGIDVTLVTVDTAQYQARTDAFDFDMAWYERPLSLSPGNEQRLYWGKEAAEIPGSRNWMGVRSDAVEAMIEAMLSSETREDFVAATRALDRVLTTGRYVVPAGYSPVSYLAHKDELRFPEALPVYGDWIGFQPDVWWHAEAE